jgi:hypothetical protein
MEEIKDVLEKLRKVEAMVEEGTTKGEKKAAENAHDRLMEKLKELEENDPPKEMKFTFQDPWGHRLFLALCRHYDLQPYRYKRQHRTTVQLKVSESFVDETLWPIYNEYYDILYDHLLDVTDEVIEKMFGNAQHSVKRLSGKN